MASILTANAFRVLGQPPLLGRDFAEADEQRGAERVAIIGYSIWKNRYGGDPSVLGRAVARQRRSGNHRRRHAGRHDVPDGFDDVDAVCSQPRRRNGATTASLAIFGRLARGVSRSEAQAEMDAIAGRMAAQYPETQQAIPAGDHPDVQRTLQRRRYPPSLPLDDGRGGLRAADRMRQRRQPSALARRKSFARDRLAHRARRLAVARHSPTARRKHPARLHRRRIRPDAGVRRRSPVRQGGLGGCRQALLDPVHDGLDRLRISRRHLCRDRHRLRARAGASGVENERQRSAEGRRTRHERQPAGAVAERNDGRHRDRADDRAARRRRADGHEVS